MLHLSGYRKTIIIIPIIIAISSILAVFSYNYFTQTAERIQSLATDDLQTNTEIESYSISNTLSNAISGVTSNLKIISSALSNSGWNESGTLALLETAQLTSHSLTDGYYHLNENGTLLTFTGMNKGMYAEYKGINLGYRDYFQEPKQKGTMYISTVIDSNDRVPRIYLSIPIIENKTTPLPEPKEGDKILDQNNSSFKGVVVASIKAVALGNFLESQVHPKFIGNTAFMDRKGTILYSANQTFIGKDYFSKEFQSYLRLILKDREEGFNDIVNKALVSESGMEEYRFENTTTTVAYKAVVVNTTVNISNNANRVGTLFITIPHTFAGEVQQLIDNQRLFNFSIIAAIASMSAIVAIILLKWNKILNNTVRLKTSQLRETIAELKGSNEELRKTQNILEETNSQLSEANMKLEKANEDLKLHDKMQRDFINIAAHELRTPTQAISGNLELIEMAYVPSLLQSSTTNRQSKINKEFENLFTDKEKMKDFAEGLASTYRNSRRLEKLVKDILDVSRIETNRLEVHKEYFNLNEKIGNVIKDIHGKTKNHSEGNGFGNRPEIIFDTFHDPITVFADKIRIFEAISNLISNAIKFSDGKPIHISVRGNQENGVSKESSFNKSDRQINNNKTPNDEKVIVSIKDNGKGIDNEILPRLFTKFATKSDKGTGLGLYIAKSIIEAHGGQVWAQNNGDGKGATFSFSLPVYKKPQ
jgi:signal transduction histidine kinase